MHVFQDVVALGEPQRVPEELPKPVSGEKLLERIAGKDRSNRQEAERNQHHRRTFVRMLVMLLEKVDGQSLSQWC